jgi:putative Mn2+ efflux pump MntP
LFSVIFETILLAAAVSVDTFVAFFAYGSRKIRVPLTAGAWFVCCVRGF